MKTHILSIVLLLCAQYAVSAQEPKPTPAAPQASGGGTAMTEPTFRLIRSVAGTKLVQDSGRYVVGVRRNVGTGFFIGPGRLLTAFQVIDGANKVRVVGPQRRPIEAVEVLAFNRRQDYENSLMRPLLCATSVFSVSRW